MDSLDRSVRPKLGLLRLADKLGSVTQACETLGYSRDSYYRFKALYERGGVDALRDISRRKPVFKNRVPGGVERAVLALTFTHPTYGQQRIAALLAEEGVSVSSSGVRSIWVRSDVETFEKRILAILAKSQQDGFSVSPEQKAAIERARTLGKLKSGRFVERPGQVCYHDFVHMGEHPRLGPLYFMCFVDAYSHYAFGRAVLDPADADPRDFLVADVLPWFARRRVRIDTVRTDRRPPFTEGGRQGYLGLLKTEGLAHTFRLTKAAQRRDAGSDIVALAAREVFQPFFRAEQSADLERLRSNLDGWLAEFNTRRAWQGAYCFGKTPLRTFDDATRFSPRYSTATREES